MLNQEWFGTGFSRQHADTSGTEFASAAMMRILTRGLYELGLPIPDSLSSNTEKATARIALYAKRELIQHALAHGGLGCLIHLGCGVHHYEHEATNRAIVSASNPRDLVVRWQRLERYIHSRHRLRIVAEGDGWLDLCHEGVNKDIIPYVYESLVVCGVLAALLSARGVRGLTILAGKVQVYPSTKEDATERLATVDPERIWRFLWNGCEEPPPSARSCGTVDDLFACTDWPKWQQDLVAYLLERLIQIPTVTDAASHLSLSLRTLQRVLKNRDLNFSNLVGDCRTRLAAMYLIESKLPLAEIGFLCGYSDQAHFTREFGKRVGMPPHKYRMAFTLR